MSISEIIKTRRTVHDFSNQTVSDDLVHRALELATWAPNHKMTNPWLFINIGDKSRSAIADLAVTLKMQKDGAGLSEVSQMAIRQKFTSCPVLVAVLKKIASDERTSLEDYASVAAGLQNAALFLWEGKIGSKWTTGPVTTHGETYKILGVDPAKEQLLGFFWIGFPKKIPSPPSRPSFETVYRQSP